MGRLPPTGGARSFLFLAPMKTPYDSLDVPLPPDIRKLTYDAVIADCRQTVSANQERDNGLWMLRQQLEGVSQSGGDANLPNSCMLEDNSPRELHTTADANIRAAFQQKPYATLQ